MTQWFGKSGLQQGPLFGKGGEPAREAHWGGVGLSLWCQDIATSLILHISPEWDWGGDREKPLDSQYGGGGVGC